MFFFFFFNVITAVTCHRNTPALPGPDCPLLGNSTKRKKKNVHLRVSLWIARDESGWLRVKRTASPVCWHSGVFHRICGRVDNEPRWLLKGIWARCGTTLLNYDQISSWQYEKIKSISTETLMIPEPPPRHQSPPAPGPSRPQPTYPTSQGSTEGAWSDINAALSGFSLHPRTCVASISGTLEATPTFGFAPKPLLSPRLLMTGPIVFRFKAIQLGVISPLSDYQWPIDREEGHAN